MVFIGTRCININRSVPTTREGEKKVGDGGGSDFIADDQGSANYD